MKDASAFPCSTFGRSGDARRLELPARALGKPGGGGEEARPLRWIAKTIGAGVAAVASARCSNISRFRVLRIPLGAGGGAGARPSGLGP
eukprot:6084971-Pyramimonas_sp.AAC.1